MRPGSTSAAQWRAHPRFGAGPTLRLVNGDQPASRLVVVSAHPDDESLGAGGLIATAAEAGLAVYVVLLTAGESSRFAAPDASRRTRAATRLAELEAALARLAPGNTMVFLGAPDGGLEASEEQLLGSLLGLVGDGERTLLAAPWRHDGHPDHEAAGRVAALVAEQTGARLLEYPLLAWAKYDVEALPWAGTVCLHLAASAETAKQDAVRAHVSQVDVAADHARPVDEAPLPERVLAYFEGAVEHFIQEPV